MNNAPDHHFSCSQIIDLTVNDFPFKLSRLRLIPVIQSTFKWHICRSFYELSLFFKPLFVQGVILIIKTHKEISYCFIGCPGTVVPVSMAIAAASGLGKW